MITFKLLCESFQQYAVLKGYFKRKLKFGHLRRATTLNAIL